jgi:predicted Zn-ribbon and HTH transcriptional regulator
MEQKKSKKQLDERCELCGDACCTKADKHIKVYFCPKCKSKDVGFIFTWGNIFGIIPKMRCRKCGFESVAFPQLHISEKKLNKMEGRKLKR